MNLGLPHFETNIIKVIAIPFTRFIQFMNWSDLVCLIPIIYIYIYIHYVTLRYVTLRYITLHYITLYIHTYICFCIPTLHPHPWVMAAMGPWPCPSRPTWLPWRPERGPARRTPPAPRNLTTEMGTANVGWRIQETHDSGDIYVYNAWTYTYIYIHI